MTATPPFVVSADDLIVRSAPRNQRASPSPGCIAMAVGDASGALGIDMGATLPMPQPFVQLRARNECGRLRGVAQARWPSTTARPRTSTSRSRDGEDRSLRGGDDGPVGPHYRIEAEAVAHRIRAPGRAPNRRLERVTERH